MLSEPNVKVDWWILSRNSWYLILSDRISTTRQEENKENSDDPWEQCGKNVIQVSQWILAVIPERSGTIIDPEDNYDSPQMGSGTAKRRTVEFSAVLLSGYRVSIPCRPVIVVGI